VIEERLVFLPVAQLSRLLHEKKVSPVELTRGYLERIGRLNSRLNAYINICEDEALEEARTAEAELLAGRSLGPMHGIPVAAKDQMDARGMPTTVGSSFLMDLAEEDSTVVARLRQAGSVFLGKLNLSEFALGGNINHPFGIPRNPWNLDYQPGHSSSGSGVAVAAGLCAAAIGEDTGGSVRTPSGWCGITGLRPTWGRVSRHGLFPLSWSMDQAGPMTRTVEDCFLVFQAIAGYDPMDPYTSRRPVNNFLRKDTLRNVRIGLVREAMENDLVNPETKEAVEKGVRILQGAGASLSEVSIPLFMKGGVISAVLTDTEGAYVHRHWLQTKAEEYDFATRRRLLAGSLMSAQFYQKVLRLRVLVRRQIMDVLKEVDVLVTPSRPIPPQKIEAETGLDSKEAVLRKYYGARGTTGPFNLAGVPAMSVPCGFTQNGLPIGMQLAARPFDETAVFEAGYVYQMRTDWHNRHPQLK
jgi:aspartyl-tRNA(Asn)/glutamyl-tRNA(Gln) amidotransferase subunit A